MLTSSAQAAVPNFREAGLYGNDTTGAEPPSMQKAYDAYAYREPSADAIEDAGKSAQRYPQPDRLPSITTLRQVYLKRFSGLCWLIAVHV